MASHSEFYHSLSVDADLCLGCAHCIRRCPTKALRIRQGKAALRQNWCIDCGECMKVCPVGAIHVEQEHFEQILSYKHPVAILPAALMGQFPESHSESEILGAIHALGFASIFPAELATDVVRQAMQEQMAHVPKPAISSFCPAVVRLIQTKFSDLIEHIVPLRAPAEATAMHARRALEAQGIPAADIGIFYITPCAAKAAAIRDDSTPRLIDGTMNMTSLYNRVCHLMRNDKASIVPAHDEIFSSLAERQMRWAMTGGEASFFAGRSLAVDGIHHVADFLERLQTSGELHEIDFLELRACNRGCVGGALTPANRFLAEERLRNRAAEHPAQTPSQIAPGNDLAARLAMPLPVAMTKLLYKGDIGEVLRQMNQAKTTEAMLPGIDCGACGSPTCRSLSNDVVRGEAVPENCIFLQLVASRGELGAEGALQRLEQVWGRERFEKKTNNLK